MIKRDIVKKIPFKSIRNSEDQDFSIRLRDSKLLQNEFKTNEILYHYVDGIKNIRNKVSFKNVPLEMTYSPWSYKFVKDAKILVKLPSRQRPAKLKSTLQLYVSKSERKNNVHYMITLDENDPTATKEFVQSLKNIHPNINVILGQSTSKISACNRDMTSEIVENYDIFLLASDDMIPKIQGWDIKISDTMNSVFPCYDGVLHFNDGFCEKRLNTMCILGREYYKLFNYFYHPDYISLWCDNEFTDMSINLKKCYYENLVIFKHEHPANLKVSQDALYKKNESFFHQDKMTYERRKNLRIFDTNEIPIIINNRNLLTWPRKMVAKLRTLNLVKSIYILDNQSTYGPLLEWYDQLQNDPVVKVIRLDKNIGHTAPWKCLEINHLLNKLYVVTDPDLNIDNLPTNILEILSSKLKQSNFQKIGLKLQTGPPFNNQSIVYQHIQDWEVKRWAKCSIQDEVANIDIDTTFALYKSNNYFIGGGSYIHNSVVHEPWSFSLETIQQNKEFLYYIYTSNKSSSFQTFLTKFAPNLEKTIFDTTAYSNYYQDLKNAFRYDTDKLFQHWKSYGHSENRKFFLK
jgi:hypothetical protein